MPPLDTSLQLFSGDTIITLFFVAAAMVLIQSNRTVDRQPRRAFLWVLGSLALIILADWFNYVMNGFHPELRFLHVLGEGLSFAIAPFLPVVIANTIFPERYAKYVFGIMGVQAALEVVSMFGGFTFYVDSANVYHRGPLYFVYMSSYIVSALYLVFESVKAGRVYQQVSVPALMAILLCMAGGVAIQIMNPSVRTSWPAVTMAVVLYFQFYSEMILRTDALTKLLNRHAYEEFLRKPSLPCTVVLLDVDKFKEVNDTYGHAFGDEILSTVASVIHRAYGKAGLCYRTGGDEFTVVLAGKADTKLLTAEFAQLMAEEKAHESRLPGISSGIALADEGCEDVAEVVKEADQAMYESKRERQGAAGIAAVSGRGLSPAPKL